MKRTRDYVPHAGKRSMPVLATPKKHADPDREYKAPVTSVVVMSPEPGKWVVVHKAKVKKFTTEHDAREFARTLL